MTPKLALTCALALSCAFIGGFAAAGPASAKRPLAMLDKLEPGRWEMRSRDEPGRARSFCLGDARKLIQLRHHHLKCDQVVLRDTATEVTVQYTCPGQGYGRTHIRRETDGLIQIDSQGIARGLPFSYAAEARRAGPCRG